ncbi:amidohydrolase [Lysobacter pythonis]|uniref:Amidohydrolase n=1 Tax=Solilutibacter pythonis TaxID=2483112 RepID=A0A3M2HLB3_9GAMM|nr:amidohydrolase [Lysobacter pythonis]RMH88663.1 amidohydrolase [Lysobacter pythonis]
MRTSTLAMALCLALASPLADAGETLVSAARIHTMDAARPTVGALVHDDDGRILALGDSAALAAEYPRAKHLDLGDATVIPGLIDAHGHMMGLGLTRLRVHLSGLRGKAEVLEKLRAFAADLPPGAWLTGRGWDQNLWPDKRFPDAADLDAAFPDRPVWLRRVDGHAGWANTAAMKLAKRPLDGDWQPAGGRILREHGKATGVLVDGAMALIEDAMPALDEATADRALALGLRDAVAHGLTGVHDAGVPLAQLRRYQRFADAGRLPLRVTAWAEGDGDALDFLCDEGPYQHPSRRLKMRSVKVYADGALGSRGAALLADYSDDRGNHGLMTTAPAELLRIARKARRCGVQMATHAIGDAGNRHVLDAYERALGADAAKAGHRWRIEHAQIVALEDIPRFARLGLIASMQPTHATSDMPWAVDRVGPARIQGAYAWRKFRDAGVRLALGSDFPIESVDPRLGLYAAATRMDDEGRPAGGWWPQEKLTAWEALRGFTLDAAYAGFAEREVGSLAPGKRADFVVLAEDPLAVPAAALRTLTIKATYVDGKAVYDAR